MLAPINDIPLKEFKYANDGRHFHIVIFFMIDDSQQFILKKAAAVISF